VETESNVRYVGMGCSNVAQVVFRWRTMWRHTAAQLVEALRSKPGRSRVQFPIVSLEFFIDVILPAALWPWCRLSL